MEMIEGLYEKMVGQHWWNDKMNHTIFLWVMVIIEILNNFWLISTN